jgi:hypothetical protein
MALVKRFTLAAMILVLAVPIALAGSNAGGVLVLHDPGLAYTSDATYAGLSGVGCGQDGPAPPALQECELTGYDPISGPNPCNPGAANPTSVMAPGVRHVWYIMAAFPAESCPRLKTLGFRIRYDASKVVVDPTLNGYDASQVSVTLPVPSDTNPPPDNQFPANGSGVSLAFKTARTSQLQELWWFVGYCYSGATDATFAVEVLGGTSGNNSFFGDDLIPVVLDPIASFGRLGLGGADGFNPLAVNPVEKTSWSRIKAAYRPR